MADPATNPHENSQAPPTATNAAAANRSQGVRRATNVGQPQGANNARGIPQQSQLNLYTEQDQPMAGQAANEQQAYIAMENPALAPALLQAHQPTAIPLGIVANDQVATVPAAASISLTRHTTFSSFYQDEHKDPMRDRYATIMARFDAMAPTPLTAEAVLETALGNPSVPGTYLCCASLHGAARPRIYLLHLMSKYVPAFDGTTTPWDNRLFCFLGKILHGTAQTVALPANVFSTVACTVYDDAKLLAELPNIGPTDMLPRLNAGAADSIFVHTRYLMYLPSKYASLFLSHNGYCVREVWDILLPVLQADNLLQQATSLTNWLRASWHVTQANNRGAPITAVALASPFMDKDLAGHRKLLLNTALPYLDDPQDPGLNSAIIQMANAVAS
jgi:hypothetical protein